jgi:parallel beta-helix repeat protein
VKRPDGFLALPLRPAWACVFLLGLLSLALPMLASLRPAPPELQAVREIRVGSGADAGPGSLREAIFAADRASERARVLIEVPGITLKTPLPPLINPKGIVLDAESSRCEIDAGALAGVPVIDVAAPHSVVSGLRIRGAAGQALLIHAEGVALRRIAVRESNLGVFVTEGSDDFRLDEAEFEGNVIGLQLPPGPLRARVRNNRFQGHTRAAVWAVAPRSTPAPGARVIDLRGNRFDRDAIGVVLINVPGRVERNQFSGERVAAVYLTGAGAAVRWNRISAGERFGVYADATEGTPIEENELDHNDAGGVLVRSARDTLVRGNRLYDNGYGIVVLFGSRTSPNTLAGNLILQQRHDGLYVVGGSPVVRENQVRNSGGAGLRVLDFIWGERPREVAEPLLAENILTGNKPDHPLRGEYRVDPDDGRKK